jgi:hypothetical protein
MKEELDADLKDLIKSDPKQAARASWQWYKKNVQQLNNMSVLAFLGTTIGKQTRTTPTPSTMCVFTYDPKGKEELPYYDNFPMVIILSVEKDRMTGLNLHYIEPKYRLILINKLLKIDKDKSYSKMDKLRVSWQLVKSFSDLPMIKHCIKCYLISHLRSNVGTIDAADWKYAVYLPLERFKKATKNQVWSDSNART